MSDLPEPFVSSEHDVRSLDGFMLNVERLLASELVAIGTPEECWAALMLWCRSWKQVPGGSLPNDERKLAGFSGAGLRWKKVREVALHGFVLCSDGRLYHRFLCEEVKKAYAKHLRYVARRADDNKRLSEWRSRQPKTASETARETHFTGMYETASETAVKPLETRTKTRTTEVEGSDANASGAGAPPDTPADPVKALWDRGLRVLGPSARTLLGKMRKEHGDPAVAEAIIVCEEQNPSDPVGFFIKTLATRAASGGANGSSAHRLNGSLFAGREQRAAAQRELARDEIARATGLAGGLAPARDSPGFDAGNSPIIDGTATRVDAGDAGADGLGTRSRGGPAWQT